MSVQFNLRKKNAILSQRTEKANLHDDVGLLRDRFRDHLGFLVSHDWLLPKGIFLIVLSETYRMKHFIQNCTIHSLENKINDDADNNEHYATCRIAFFLLFLSQ